MRGHPLGPLDERLPHTQPLWSDSHLDHALAELHEAVAGFACAVVANLGRPANHTTSHRDALMSARLTMNPARRELGA